MPKRHALSRNRAGRARRVGVGRGAQEVRDRREVRLADARGAQREHRVVVVVEKPELQPVRALRVDEVAAHRVDVLVLAQRGAEARAELAQAGNHDHAHALACHEVVLGAAHLRRRGEVQPRAAERVAHGVEQLRREDVALRHRQIRVFAVAVGEEARERQRPQLRRRCRACSGRTPCRWRKGSESMRPWK